jgi:hypothetical protein
MAYKKYIRRNGKLYGPYLYESKRVDGRVVSEYHGSEEPKKQKGVKVRDYKKMFFIFAGILLIGILVYFLVTFPNYSKLSGKAVLGVDTSYEIGKPLEGVLKLSLKEGELIPASSKIVFENANRTYEFPLNGIVDESPSNGKYYLEGKAIGGTGEGYGNEGQRIVYPEVKFVLQIYNQVTEKTPTEETNTETTENTSEENAAPITGNSVSNSGGFLRSLFGISGMVSMELQREVNGVTTKEEPFVYNLAEGENAELKPRSVSINGEEVADNVISLHVEDNKVTVTTDYSESEKGYGAEYIGNSEKTISLDLSDLNLNMEEGDLNIKLVYGNEDILQLITTLKEGEESSGEVVNEEITQGNENETDQIGQVVEVPIETNISEEIVEEENETMEEIVNSSLWDLGDFLTPQEKKILADKFGNIPINNVKSELYNGRIIRDYEFGGYTVEYSYDPSVNKDILEMQMEKDRIKFLKDIANLVSEEDSFPKPLEGFNNTYLP